jgi:dTDP-glucose 4,6-dehydratase
MKVLITGVLGVIGSKLEEVLKARGHDVFGVDLFHTNRPYGHGLGLVDNEDYFRCDISEYRQIERVIEHVEPHVVYNCAAEFGRWNGEHFYEKVWTSNVIGMKHIIRLQEKHGFKLVHCSSSEVYGDYSNVMYEDVLEQTPIIQMSDYAMSKRVNEMQIHNSQEQFNTYTVVVRFFNTYGPGEWYHPFRSVNCVFTYNLLHGRPITVFNGHTRTSTYVYDSARTLANILDNFISGETYNIASNQTHTIEDLAALLVKYTKADPSLVAYKDHGEVLTTKHKYVDVSKSIADLGHEDTVSLEEGVLATVKWMKEYYAC